MKDENDIRQYHSVDRFLLNDTAQIVQFDFIYDNLINSILYKDIECLWVNNCKVALNRKEY